MVNVAQNFNVMGTFGRIYPAKDVDTGERFAFKRIMPITHATGTLDELRRVWQASQLKVVFDIDLLLEAY